MVERRGGGGGVVAILVILLAVVAAVVGVVVVVVVAVLDLLVADLMSQRRIAGKPSRLADDSYGCHLVSRVAMGPMGAQPRARRGPTWPAASAGRAGPRRGSVSR